MSKFNIEIGEIKFFKKVNEKKDTTVNLRICSKLKKQTLKFCEVNGITFTELVTLLLSKTVAK